MSAPNDDKKLALIKPSSIKPKRQVQQRRTAQEASINQLEGGIAAKLRMTDVSINLGCGGIITSDLHMETALQKTIPIIPRPPPFNWSFMGTITVTLCALIHKIATTPTDVWTFVLGMPSVILIWVEGNKAWKNWKDSVENERYLLPDKDQIIRDTIVLVKDLSERESKRL